MKVELPKVGGDDEVRRLRLDLERRELDRDVEEVQFTFGAANTDHDIRHSLIVKNPESIVYRVVRKDRVCDIYDNQAVGRRAWTSSYIVLRSSVANAKVTLRLSTR